MLQNTHVKLENTKLRGELAKAKTFMQQATVENDGLRDAIDKLKQELNSTRETNFSLTKELSTAYRGNGYGLSSRKPFPTRQYANESDSEDIPTASQLLSRERSESVETNQDVIYIGSESSGKICSRIKGKFLLEPKEINKRPCFSRKDHGVVVVL